MSNVDLFSLPLPVLALVFYTNPWLIFGHTEDEWDGLGPDEREELEEQLFAERPELQGIMAEHSRLTSPS